MVASFRSKGGSGDGLSKPKLIARLAELLEQLSKTIADIFGDSSFGAAVAEMARRAGAVVMGVVTAPFHFEGKRRAELAAAAIEEMRGIVDVLVVVENDRLLEILPGGTAMEDAMRVADEVLLEAIRGVSSLITSSQARATRLRGAIPMPAHTARANS